MRNETLNDKAKRQNTVIYIIGALGIVVFAIALFLVLSGNASLIDDPIRYWFYSLRSDGLNTAVSLLTCMGNWQVITALCIIMLAIPQTRVPVGLPLSIGSLLVLLTNKIIKHIVQRPRPDDILHLIDESGYSFSSGHSISSMFAYGLLLYLVLTCLPNEHIKNTAWKVVLTIVLTVLAFGIGLSRIFVGVHYPTDVLAGWSLGVLAIAVTAWILQKLQSPTDLR